MTRTELIKLYAEEMLLTQGQAKEHLEQLGNIIAAELLDGGEVPLPGLGRLVVKPTAARKGRNPRTGKVIDIPAGRKVIFRPTVELKEAL